jgi:hypothetical protein
MIGGNDENDDTDFDDMEDDNLDDDAMPDIGGETMVDVSGELDDDADELIRVSRRPDPAEAARRREVRRRLEEIAESRRQQLDDTFNFNLDDDF